MGSVNDFEVIIVGGGPAGSSAANRLALGDRAENALLLERLDNEDFSKYHRMCAEGISRRGLMETGLDISGTVRNKVNKVVEHWPGNVSLSSDIDGLIIDRNKLIARLREPFLAEGGRVKRSPMIDIHSQEDKFVVRTADTEYSCDYVIGADGAHSQVRKRLFNAEPKTSMTVIQYLVDKPAEHCLKFLFDKRYKGKYRWEFPSGEFTKIGYPVGSDEKPEDILEVHSRTIPIGPMDRIVEGRACLVGDAASQANPVTFSGIRNGMTAGRMAADAVMEGDLKLYQDSWSKSPQADLCFYESYQRLRSMANEKLQELVEPFRYGPNLSAIMRDLMNSQDFRTFYQSHVRKLESGW